MSSNTLLRVLALLAALLVVWGGVALFRGSLSDAPAGLDLPHLTAADVDRIELTTGVGTARIERVLTGWTVNGYPAAASQVNDLVSALADSGLSTEVVARSAGSHARLGVDSLAGHRFRVLKGDRVLVDLLVGNQGRTYQTAYVRRDGDDEVYLLRGHLASMLDRDLDGWRDHTIATVTPDSVAALRIERGRQAVSLTRRDSTWVIGSAPADSAAVGRVLSALSDLAAAGFASDSLAGQLDFARPDRRLLALNARGDTLLALLVDSAASGIWVRRGTGPTVFRLDAWRLDQLMPADSTLRAR
jgi:hypothetical protein